MYTCAITAFWLNSQFSESDFIFCNDTTDMALVHADLEAVSQTFLVVRVKKKHFSFGFHTLRKPLSPSLPLVLRLWWAHWESETWQPHYGTFFHSCSYMPREPGKHQIRINHYQPKFCQQVKMKEVLCSYAPQKRELICHCMLVVTNHL